MVDLRHDDAVLALVQSRDRRVREAQVVRLRAPVVERGHRARYRRHELRGRGGHSFWCERAADLVSGGGFGFAAGLVRRRFFYRRLTPKQSKAGRGKKKSRSHMEGVVGPIACAALAAASVRVNPQALPSSSAGPYSPSTCSTMTRTPRAGHRRLGTPRPRDDSEPAPRDRTRAGRGGRRAVVARRVGRAARRACRPGRARRAAAASRRAAAAPVPRLHVALMKALADDFGL